MKSNHPNFPTGKLMMVMMMMMMMMIWWTNVIVVNYSTQLVGYILINEEIDNTNMGFANDEFWVNHDVASGIPKYRLV